MFALEIIKLGLKNLRTHVLRSLLTALGIILGVAQTVANELAIGWDLLAGHAVFLAVLLLRPNGLLGKGVAA